MLGLIEPCSDEVENTMKLQFRMENKKYPKLVHV